MEKFKHHRTRDKCDFCGHWVNEYKCFFDVDNKALCICEKCHKENKYQRIENLKLDFGGK